MKFLLDESADARLKSHLVGLQHDVTAINPDYTKGIPDEEVLNIALKEERVLIADDKDFGELIFKDKLPHSGVILYHVSRLVNSHSHDSPEMIEPAS